MKADAFGGLQALFKPYFELRFLSFAGLSFRIPIKFRYKLSRSASGELCAFTAGEITATCII